MIGIPEAMVLLSIFWVLDSTEVTFETSKVILEVLSDTDHGNCSKTETALDIFRKLYPIKSWEEAGFFDEQYLRKINPHWLQFPPQNKYSHYVLGVAYVFIMMIGLTGNCLIIFMFLRCKSLRTPGNILILNLAISDGLMMCEMPLFIYNSFQEGPALGDVACQIYGFLGGLSGTVSICTLTAISVDRFYVIKYPLNREFNSIRSKICLVISWFYGLTFASIPLLDTKLGSYVPEGFLTSCSFDFLTSDDSVRIFIFAFFVAAWVLPIIFIGYSYANIIRTLFLQDSLKAMNNFKTESFRCVKVEEKNKQELRLAIIIFFIVILWVIAWTPYAVVALLGIFDMKHLITPFSSVLPALFCKSASCLDPFIYALTHTKFKRELKALIFGRDARKQTQMKRVWKSKLEKRKSVVEKTMRMDISQSYDDDIEVQYINVSPAMDSISSHVKISRDQFTMGINNPDIDDFGVQCSKWIFKPNFSNKRSSMRKLARNLSQHGRSNLDL